jgi:hypothetical protein
LLAEKNHRVTIFVIFELLCTLCLAQSQTTNDLYINANRHYGYLLPEYQFVNYLENDNIHSIDLRLSKQTTGEDIWQQLYKYPSYGISLFVSTLGNNEVFGKQIALYPFCSINIIGNRIFNLYYQIGPGICYVTKKYDKSTDYENIAIGSNLNIFFNFEIGTKLRLYKKIYFTGGLAFHHYSNANLQEPNLGLNYLTIFGGLSYLLGKQSERTVTEIPPFHRSNDFFIVYAAGGRHSRALTGYGYFTSSVSLEMKRKLFYKFHLGIGSDLFYDTSTKSEMESKGEGTEYKKQYDFTSGLHLSEEFVFNRLSLIIQEGIYLLLTDKVNHYVMYNRGTIRYKFSNHLMGSLSMKSHLQILDYPELGIGYCW